MMMNEKIIDGENCLCHLSFLSWHPPHLHIAQFVNFCGRDEKEKHTGALGITKCCDYRQFVHNDKTVFRDSYTHVPGIEYVKY